MSVESRPMEQIRRNLTYAGNGLEDAFIGVHKAIRLESKAAWSDELKEMQSLIMDLREKLRDLCERM